MRNPAQVSDRPIPAAALARLFDALPDVVFFVKDATGRYTHVNRTLVRRLGCSTDAAVTGRLPQQLFPAPLGATYAAQDQQVLMTGKAIENLLEVHLFARRAPGWCLTCKYPLRDRDTVVGLIGISRDLGRPDEHSPIYARLADVVRHLQTHYAEPVRMDAMARLAGMSIAQLERHWQRVFQLTPQQSLTKLRMDRAMQLLCAPGSIAAIAQACGYADQSAFTRQFHKLTGATPAQYRALHAAEA
ncbi:MAG TPA: AraC family transcriptional regulator [Rhodanobacteraceae bacterium]